jgi:hypothetical protein
MLAGFQLLVELTRFPLFVCSLSISSMKREKFLSLFGSANYI